jgi:hypothetical protein
MSVISNNKEQRHAKLVSASHFRLKTCVLLNTTLKQVQGDGRYVKLQTISQFYY